MVDYMQCKGKYINLKSSSAFLRRLIKKNDLTLFIIFKQVSIHLQVSAWTDNFHLAGFFFTMKGNLKIELESIAEEILIKILWTTK